MVVYADILFLVDMSMDFLTLSLCARLTHRPTKGIRVGMASVLGALGSVLLVILGAGRYSTFLTGLVLSAVMTGIAFGLKRTYGGGWRGLISFGKQWLTVWGCGAVTGGVLSVLMSLGEPVYVGTTEKAEPGFFALFLATAVVIYGFLRLLGKRITTKTAEITIEWHDKKAVCTVLLDTGNLLREPMTGKPVILISQEAVVPLELPTGEPTDTGRYFPIVAKGVGTARLLWGIRPDRLLVNGVPREALVAAEEVPATHYGGMGGTCPGCLA